MARPEARGGRGGGRRGGRGKGRGGGRGGRGGGGRGGDDRDRQSGGYDSIEIIMKNKKFEAYYLDQGILAPEEWETFMNAFKAPLPTTFRITPGKPTTKLVQKEMLDNFQPALTDVTYEGEAVPPPKQIEWYPEGLGWQIDVKKNVLRKEPQFKKFQQFLVHETVVGSISRQEAVSMIPPLFLDVRPHHIVMDMCAAPGSKTAQLIEALHCPNSSDVDNYNPCPPGLIIANDSDTKRAHMLVHQSSRLPSPNLVITNHDASAWPRIDVPWMSKDSDKIVNKALRFDRVLADVPCSGDGTLRKNLGIWKEWQINNGTGLHALQLRILLRGLSILRPGGRLVYSTCSLNPIENEAVVSAALRHYGADPAVGQTGTLRLVDASAMYPKLVRRKGMTTWRVCPGKGAHLMQSQGSKEEAVRKEETAAPKEEDKAADETAGESTDAGATAAATEEQAAGPTPGTPAYRATLPGVGWVESYEKLQALDATLAERTAKTLWPCGQEQAMGLEHCMRVYPHLQDTGGFFVAVLQLAGDEEEEGMAQGMIRAMDARDAVDAKRRAEAAAAAATADAEAEAGKKRAASPSGAEDVPDAKRHKAEEAAAVDVEAEEAAFNSADPNAHLKPDNHKAAREARNKNDLGQGLPGGLPWREDPFTFVAPDHAQVKRVIEAFGLTDDFPRYNLLVRNVEGNPLRTAYMTSTAMRALISSGGPGVDGHPSMNPRKLRAINVGVKTLARQETAKDALGEVCKWRAISDGAPVIRPFVAHEKMCFATLADLAHLVEHHYPLLSQTPNTPFFTSIREKRIGNFFVDVLPGEHEGATLHTTLSFPVWRAVASINLMLDKQEKSALSFRLFGKDLSNPTGERQLTSDKNQQAQAKAKKEKQAAAAAALKDAPTEEDLMELENKGVGSSAGAGAAVTEEDDVKEEERDAALAAVEEEGQDLNTPPPEEEA